MFLPPGSPASNGPVSFVWLLSGIPDVVPLHPVGVYHQGAALPVNGAVRGTFAAPLPPLPGTATPIHGRASLFVASPGSRGSSGRSVTPWRVGHAGTFGDVAASSGGPSPGRAHGRCALGSRGCSPVALGLRAQAGPRLYELSSAQVQFRDRRHTKFNMQYAYVIYTDISYK
ncbi:hypothetical protein T06_1801 [Trichinella sp. T6]|nr:hypothetical protein T06_1801 [Trichinella sp. T6]